MFLIMACQRREKAHIQRLQKMRCVSGQAQEKDIVASTKLYDFDTDM